MPRIIPNLFASSVSAMVTPSNPNRGFIGTIRYCYSNSSSFSQEVACLQNMYAKSGKQI
jgi:hypothetical protein